MSHQTAKGVIERRRWSLRSAPLIDVTDEGGIPGKWHRCSKHPLETRFVIDRNDHPGEEATDGVRPFVPALGVAAASQQRCLRNERGHDDIVDQCRVEMPAEGEVLVRD